MRAADFVIEHAASNRKEGKSSSIPPACCWEILFEVYDALKMAVVAKSAQQKLIRSAP
jgi:hypothetical protein